MPEPAATPAGIPAAQPQVRRGRWIVILLLAFAGLALFAAIEQLSTRKGGQPLIEVNGVNDAQRIFGGIPSAGDRLGDSDAPVIIQVFNDVQCSTCSEEFLQTIPQLADTEVRDGDVQLRYRNYSFSINPVQQGFIAAVAAGEQGYQWPYVYLLFRNQGEAERLGGVTGDFLTAIASSIEELDVPQWEKDFGVGGGANGRITQLLTEQDETAQGLGLRAAPSAIVTGPSGTETLQDSPTLREIRAAIGRVD